MKRLFTILIAIILCSFTLTLFSQNFNKTDFAPKVENGHVLTVSEILLNKKLTSVLGQVWVPSNWVDETRQIYEYNNAGLMSKLEFQKIENSEWKTKSEVLFEYNAENQMVVNIMWFYEDDRTVAMGTKWEHTYSGIKIDEGIRSDWDVDNGIWEIDLKWVYEYTGEVVSKLSEYQFVSDWVLSQQYSYTYDAQVREIEELIEIWNESGGVFENSNLTTTTYHPNGQISEELSKSWDIDNQQWSDGNYFLYEFQYDANGNRIEYVSTMAIEFSGYSMMTKSKLQSEYDSNNYLIEDLDFTWDENTSVWSELEKSEYTNDAEGNPLVVIIYNKLSGTWDYSEKITYNYDGAVGVELDENSIPEIFILSQNYPNPFNPSTTIKYSIPAIDANLASTTNVILKIYDTLGKEVATLVDKVKQPGNYEVEFNASNLTSGIYFYSLKSGNNLMTKKCLLVK
ncbi:MAG: T9SS type A sorting domain-containing protein [Ignavibacteriae bacterium]|nr:T9SS type A sorting domain-containing protein [Ignavibacteriota bacterium]